MGSLNSTDKLVISREVVLYEEFDDWSVLYHPLFDHAIAIGPVGEALWKALDGKHTLAEIAVNLKAQCEDAPDTILEDILAFSQDLYRYSFVNLALPEGEGA